MRQLIQNLQSDADGQFNTLLETEVAAAKAFALKKTDLDSLMETDRTRLAEIEEEVGSKQAEIAAFKDAGAVARTSIMSRPVYANNMF